MERSVVERVLQQYGIASRAILAPQKGYRNSSFAVMRTNAEPLNLILYKNEPHMQARITRTNAIGDFVYTRGLPARHTFSPRIMQLKNTRQTRYAALYYYLPGATIPWEAYTMARLKALGKTMGDMHAELANYPGALPHIIDELTARDHRMIRYFTNQDVQRALAQNLNLHVVKTDFLRLLEGARNLPSHALHMDFVRGNILFDGASITGILDFEKAAYGPPAFDIARTLAFLYVDCKYKTGAKVYKYFITSGYHKRGRATLTDLEFINALVPFFLLHDFYKFLWC